jgi:hypothetical protein
MRFKNPFENFFKRKKPLKVVPQEKQIVLPKRSVKGLLQKKIKEMTLENKNTKSNDIRDKHLDELSKYKNKNEDIVKIINAYISLLYLICYSPECKHKDDYGTIFRFIASILVSATLVNYDIEINNDLDVAFSFLNYLIKELGNSACFAGYGNKFYFKIAKDDESDTVVLLTPFDKFDNYVKTCNKTSNNIIIVPVRIFSYNNKTNRRDYHANTLLIKGNDVYRVEPNISLNPDAVAMYVLRYADVFDKFKVLDEKAQLSIVLKIREEFSDYGLNTGVIEIENFNYIDILNRELFNFFKGTEYNFKGFFRDESYTCSYEHGGLCNILSILKIFLPIIDFDTVKYHTINFCRELYKQYTGREFKWSYGIIHYILNLNKADNLFKFLYIDTHVEGEEPKILSLQDNTTFNNNMIEFILDTLTYDNNPTFKLYLNNDWDNENLPSKLRYYRIKEYALPLEFDFNEFARFSELNGDLEDERIARMEAYNQTSFGSTSHKRVNSDIGYLRGLRC